MDIPKVGSTIYRHGIYKLQTRIASFPDQEKLLKNKGFLVPICRRALITRWISGIFLLVQSLIKVVPNKVKWEVKLVQKWNLTTLPL